MFYFHLYRFDHWWFCNVGLLDKWIFFDTFLLTLFSRVQDFPIFDRKLDDRTPVLREDFWIVVLQKIQMNSILDFKISPFFLWNT